MSVFAYMPVLHEVCRDQKTSCRTQFSSSKIRVLEIKLYRNQVQTSHLFVLFVVVVGGGGFHCVAYEGHELTLHAGATTFSQIGEPGCNPTPSTSRGRACCAAISQAATWLLLPTFPDRIRVLCRSRHSRPYGSHMRYPMRYLSTPLGVCGPIRFS